jgi:hypothetical protein
VKPSTSRGTSARPSRRKASERSCHGTNEASSRAPPKRADLEDERQAEGPGGGDGAFRGVEVARSAIPGVEVEDEVGVDRHLLDREREVEPGVGSPGRRFLLDGRESCFERLSEARPDLPDGGGEVRGREGVDVDVAGGRRGPGRAGEVEVAPVEVDPGQEVVDPGDVVTDLLVR